MRVTVTSNGRVTIPAELRQRMGIRPGTRIEFIMRDANHLDAVLVTESLKAAKGMLPSPKRTLTIEEMNEAIGRGARKSRQ